MGALKAEDLNYTYDDYKEWEGDWELFDGLAVAMSPAPMRKHQGLAAVLIKEMGNAIDDCTICEVLGEVDYKISEHTTLRPDVVLSCGETHAFYLTKSPEIIVEIISKSTARRDEVYKFEIYEKEKVNYYIIVYPDELLAKVYKLNNAKYDKQGDFSDETYVFEETFCNISLDFNKVFKRFR